MIIYISLEIITILIHYASESNSTRSKLRFRISKIIWSHHSTKWKSNESIINLRYSQADIQVAKITDQKIDNLWLETGCEPTTDIAFMPAMQMAWCTTSKSNTSVRDTDSQKYEGGRVVAVLSFDRCVSVLPNESGLNETNIDCPWMPTWISISVDRKGAIVPFIRVSSTRRSAVDVAHDQVSERLVPSIIKINVS